MTPKLTHILLEVGQLASLGVTVLTLIPTEHAPGWVPAVAGLLGAIATWAKQTWGNTPQNAAK